MADINGTEGADILNGGGDDDTINGLGGNDTLNGNGGDDVLDGGAGADIMYGGADDDTYYVDDSFDQTLELAGEGYDRVLTSISFSLALMASEIEVLLTTDTLGTDAIDLTGNGFANSIYGNRGDNVLTGGGGNDYIIGLNGNDILDGGAGADAMAGGVGDDTYYVDDVSDVVVEGTNQGYDRIVASFSYALGIGQSIEYIAPVDVAGTSALDFTGNELNNSVYGNAGANILVGGAGDDYVVGLGGNDTLYGQDGIDALDGGDGHDVLLGGDGADYLVGGAGNDAIDGGAGADQMFGGAGDDLFIVDNAADTVSELSNEGFDRLISSVSYTILFGSTNQIEVMQTANSAGTEAIDFTGNESANSIYGNDGANTLTARGGNDYVIGLGGDDVITGGSGGDAIDGGDGNDTINGGANHDVLIGGAGNDVLNDGGGTVNNGDLMYGGTGDDTYYAFIEASQVFELAGEGNDTVFTSASMTLAPGNEIELLQGATEPGTSPPDLTLTGNELNNTIIGGIRKDTINGLEGNDTLSGGFDNDLLSGNAGNDTLDGGAGIDALSGGTGADVLDGGIGSDTLNGGADADGFRFSTALDAGNVDLVQDFLEGVDEIQLDDAIFTALTPGALAASAFVSGSAPIDADDRIIYDPANGALYYDADGLGGNGMVQFAQLSGGLVMTASDFAVI